MTINPIDPKLKEAAEEIRQVLLKHDIAGTACICSGERSEYINHFIAGGDSGPTWSCLYLEDGAIRVRAKGSRSHTERWKLNHTVKMLHTMRELFTMQFGMFDQLCELVGRNLKIEHGDSAHVPGK